jgi:hypothetical protein
MLDDLTKFVLVQGVDLEERWTREHRPNPEQTKCITCNVHANGGRCMFNRAAHDAREIRLAVEE